MPDLLTACGYCIMRSCFHAYLNIRLWRVIVLFALETISKRKPSAYYSELAKGRFANAGSDDSTQVSVDV